VTAVERAVRGWLNHLDVERGVSANTLKSYRRDLARYTAYLGGRGVTDPASVTEAHVSDFLATLREGSADHPPLAASSAARTLVAVRGFHRFLVLEGDTTQDPAGAVSPPRPPARLPKAISVEDVERLLAAAGVGDTPASLRDRALLEVLYGAGARISEAVGLDVDDVDTAEGVVRLFGKGSKERVVPLGSYAAEALSAYLVRGRPVLASKGRGTPAIFLNQRGGRLSRQSAWAALRAARRHPPARRRRRRAGGAGAARARLRHDDPDLHDGDRATPSRGLRPEPPACALIGSVRSARG
jgi:integrase/recombinase XerD